jgi:catechol 2,3-dioxygenase-like lactoylglutathione lyase family enzyme
MKPWGLYEVVLDCPEPRELAEWYRRVTGWAYAAGHETVDPDGDQWLALVPPGGGTKLAFQRSGAAVAPWRAGGRVHLDLAVPDLAAAHEQLTAHGAVVLTGAPDEEGHPQDRFRVYADPVGHAFCAVEVRAAPA